MTQFKPSDFPGYLEAVEQENLLRDAAFLALPVNICGFEICQMTLRHWLMLRIAKSPMIFGGVPTPEQLAQFLWVMSPAYNPEGRGRWRFTRMCRKAFHNPEWTQNIVAGVNKFVSDTMQDREGATVNRDGFDASYYSDAAFLCGLLGMHLHYSVAEVMELPLAQIFQFKKVILQLQGSDVPLGNASDGFISNYLEKLNQERRRN